MALNLAPFGRWTLRDKAAQRRLALRSAYISAGTWLFRTPLYVDGGDLMANPAVDPVPFGHWALRDKAAQRRSAFHWASS